MSTVFSRVRRAQGAFRPRSALRAPAQLRDVRAKKMGMQMKSSFPPGATFSLGGGSPVADACSSSEAQVRTDLAAAYRLAARAGWDDLVYSHISAAVPGEPGRFLINAFGLGFDEIGADDLVKVDSAGNICEGGATRSINRAGFALHAAVHTARPDAMCVMHLHETSAIAVSTHARGLLPLSQHALRFHGCLAYHDYEGVALSVAESGRLIASLGDKPAALLRNHGTLVIGRTIAEAYTLSATLIKACRIQVAALAGNPDPIVPPPDVAARAALQLFDNGAVEGVWEWPVLLRSLPDRTQR
jgi:ribulose-5-phosphate 4-epimerase/fuculose-1-phosphate aldolase